MYTDENYVENLELQIKALNQQVQELLAQKASERDFLAHIAHELRTPLNTIIGFAQILDRHTKVSDEQREYLSLILISSEHLLSLINDILQMSKLEAGRIALNSATFDIFELIEGIESIYKAEAKDKGLHFKIHVAQDLPQFVVGDSSKIRQILSNLLSNAIKFTDSGCVTLTLFPESSEDLSDHLQLVFAVNDTGQGIKAEEIEQLFKPYQQTTSGKESNKGTGLRLAITYQLIELMNGHIQIDSEWEQGSTFTVMIQVGQSDVHDAFNDAETSITGLELGATSHRILVVDDSHDNRQLLDNILSKIGFELEFADNGQCAINKFEAWRPDLILMDMRMPILNGYEATKRIRALDTRDDVIILALTANAFESQDHATMSTGCDDYIIKPFRISNLLRKIGEHLNLPIMYGETSPLLKNGQSTTISSELDTLSPDTAKRLSIVASSYSIEQVNTMMDELPPNLAKFIRQCIDEFDFDTIISLLNS